MATLGSGVGGMRFRGLPTGMPGGGAAGKRSGVLLLGGSGVSAGGRCPAAPGPGHGRGARLHPAACADTPRLPAARVRSLRRPGLWVRPSQPGGPSSRAARCSTALGDTWRAAASSSEGAQAPRVPRPRAAAALTDLPPTSSARVALGCGRAARCAAPPPPAVHLLAPCVLGHARHCKQARRSRAGVRSAAAACCGTPATHRRRLLRDPSRAPRAASGNPARRCWGARMHGTRFGEPGCTDHSLQSQRAAKFHPCCGPCCGLAGGRAGSPTLRAAARFGHRKVWVVRLHRPARPRAAQTPQSPRPRQVREEQLSGADPSQTGAISRRTPSQVDCGAWAARVGPMPAS